jgi:ABC-type amino acid transport substrate-binding protein
MFRKYLPFLIVALAVTLVAGAVVLRPVLASTLQNTTQNTTQYSPVGRGFGGMDDEYLAKALNITVDELQAAYQKAWSAALDQAVADGQITQAQADQMKANGDGKGGFRGMGGWDKSGTNFDQLLADALGISVDKLHEAYQTAYNARLDQAVTDGAITQDRADLMKAQYALYSSQSFRDSMQAAYEQAVTKAVADGVITQAQADQILKDNSGSQFPGLGPWGGMGGFHQPGGGGDMRGGGRPPFPGTSPTPNNNASPTPSS